MDLDDLKIIISQGEGYRLEFKESFSESTGKEICAFANARGGKILLGVKDDGTIIGIKPSNKLKSRIYDIARNFDPPLHVTLEDAGPVLIINVDEGIHKPYSLNGRFFMRYGTNSQQLGRDEIRDFFRDENIVNFDDKVNREFVFKTDFSHEKFIHFLEIANISPVIKKEKILENLGLLKDGMMRNAGILLFCPRVTPFFLSATLSCFLYMGTDKYKILDKKEFDGDIYSNYKNAMKYLMAHLNTEFIIRSGPREERLELPEDALREAVLNAIAHRDYFSTSNIHVNIFKDRVEIVNPGGLYGNLTLEDIYEKSIPRNPLLFGLMERMDLVEKAGSGLVRIEKAMRDYGLEKPVIKTDKNWFQVIFLRPELQADSFEQRKKQAVYEDVVRENAPVYAPVNAPVKISTIQKRIILEMRNDPWVTYDKLAQLLKKDRSTIKRNIKRLKELNRVERVGSDKTGYWQVLSGL